MFRVYVNKNIELDINDTLDYLYDEFGIEYTEDIKNRILQQIEFLEQNALAKNIEPEIKTTNALIIMHVKLDIEIII